VEVFLLLGVIWAAVLVPQWLENRRVARPTASIASFNQQLWSLERTTPTYEDSAYGSTYGDAPLAPGRRGRVEGTGNRIVFDDYRDDEVPDGIPGPAAGRPPEAGPVTPLDAARARARRPARVDDHDGRARAGRAPDAPPAAPAADRADAEPAVDGHAHRRAAAVRRRRQVFLTLLVMAVVTAAPAALAGRWWWVAHGVADGLFFVYVALLVRRQRRLAERAEKVHYLSPIRAPRPAVVVLDSGTGTDR
jgi:hypothetical protein